MERGGDVVTLHVPLGVRIFSPVNSLDVWVTNWVTDLTYRSVIPGGFESASFTLHLPQHLAPAVAAYAPRAPRTSLVKLFNKVQVVDLRSCEVAWEGRIESAPRHSDDPWAFDIGCTGAMAVAKDITRPVFYADSLSEDWQDWTGYNPLDFSQSGKTDKTFTFTTAPGAVEGPDSPTAPSILAYEHDLCSTTNQFLARFAITYDLSLGAAAATNQLRTRASVVSSTGGTNYGVDNTTFGSSTRKTNVIVSDFSLTTGQTIRLDIYCTTAGGISTGSGRQPFARYSNPIVIPVRQDRNGTNLLTAASYPNDYVLVSQVVEDVVGRFLGGGWSMGGSNNPTEGQVSGASCFINADSAAQITHLKWTDGTTAAEILNTLMTVQPDAYWAIWESSFTATTDPEDAKYRFEWSTWPDGWGYQASSSDGLDEQPDASNIYNFVFYTYREDYGEGQYAGRCQEWWDYGDPAAAPLLQSNVTRAATVVQDGYMDGASAVSAATAFIANNGTEKNTGSLTVGRPIHLFDKGTGSYSGASRMVDPHMIRPGKLIKITDLDPVASSQNFGHGDTAPPSTHVGSVFKVVATTYDAASNKCVMELDQPATWSIPGQFIPPKGTGRQVIPG